MTPPADRDRLMTHDEAVELVSAYAIDALDRDERVSFEVHLTTCDVCARELREFRRVTAAIAMGEAPVAPPASLKAKVLTKATARRSASAPVRLPVPAAVRQRPLLSPWLAAAAGLVAAAGLGIYAWSLHSELASTRRTIAEYSVRVDSLRDQLAAARLDSARLINTISVMGAPDVIKVSLTGKNEAAAASGRAYLSASRGLIFETERMPVLPAGKIYQLWVIPAGQTPVSAGVFTVNPAGVVSLATQIPAGVVSAQIVAVTIEDGPTGAPQPTTQPILVGQVGS